MMRFRKDKNIFVIGDVHGAIEMAVYNMQHFWSVKNSVVIFAGDVGLGFGDDKKLKHRLQLINKSLIKYDNTIVFMRGNHDNPDTFNKRWKEFSYSNIKTIPDYTVIKIGEKKILCIGGAISIDRKVRKQGVDYWYNEKFVLDKNKIEKYDDITHVVTHNSPSFAAPVTMGSIVYYYSENDSTLLNELMQERMLHTELFDYLTKERNFLIKEWHYGHFHFEEREIIDDTKFVLHGIGQLSEMK